MSKFFKVFGISAAIGTLAYAIFKYKHDEKFKEKTDEKMGEAKAKAKEVKYKAIDKACIFAVDHPKIVLGVMGGGVVIGSALAGIAVHNGFEKFKVARALNKTYDLEGKELVEHEKWWNDNGYGDNYRTIYEFAKDLPLHEEEAFGIARYCEGDQTVTCVLQEYNNGKQHYQKKEYI